MIVFMIFGLFLAIILLFCHVFVIYCISEIFNKKDKIITKLLYLTLLKYFGIFIIIFIFLWLLSSILYEIIYILCFIYIGYFLNVFLLCLLYKLISKYYQLNPLFSKILVFIIPLIITIYSLINAQITEFKEETLIYPGFSNTIKIMHISDLHLGAVYQKGSIEKIVKITNEKKPDILVITGDLCDGSEKVESEWLEPLNSINDKIPVLYVTGNHENLYGKKEILNEIYKIKKINHIGDSEEITYIKDVIFLGLDFEYNDVKNRIKSIVNKYDLKNKKAPMVFLYHIPKVSLKDLNEIGIFLMLAGHTHGGQIFPFTIFAWFSNKYFSGLYSYEKKNYVFVSTGYGTALVPMRFLSSKMIGLITIKGT